MSAAQPRYVTCPDCDYPLDPAALPRHPSHDITDEQLDELARMDEAKQAKAEAQRWAQVRIEERRARAARPRRKR